MRWTVVILGLVAGLGYWLHRVSRPDLSEAWRVDHERREWGKGQEGISWKWPVIR